MSRLEGEVIAVTGGAGFLGSHLVDRLLELGASEVRVLDDLSSGTVDNLVDAARDHRLVLEEIDVEDEAATVAALRGVDRVVHLAAVKHNRDAGTPARVARVNVQGTLNVLEGLVATGARQIVFASSLYTYGKSSSRPWRESDPSDCHTVYGATKVAGEALCRAYGASRGVKWTVLRYFFVYGPRLYRGAYSDSLVAGNLRRLRRGEQPTIYGDGSQTLDWIHIDDALRATLAVLEAEETGAVYNVGTGVGTTVLDVCRLLADLTNSAFAPRFLPADWTQGTSRVADVQKLRRKHGFVPRIGMREGLIGVVDQFPPGPDRS